MKHVRKVLSLALSLILALSLCTTAMAADGAISTYASFIPREAKGFFSDLPDTYSENVAYNLYKAGIMYGTDTKLFSPDEQVDAATAVTVLGRLAGVKQEGAGNSWYGGYMDWAKSNGIVSGSVKPDDLVTVKDVDAMLAACAKLMGVDYTAASTSADAATRNELAQMVYYVYYLKTAGLGKLGVVKTEKGLLAGTKGINEENVTVYRGVPYAAAPVGDLRWKEAQPHAAWEGVRVSDIEGDAPMMPDYVKEMYSDTEHNTWAEFYPEGTPLMSEDCLYLNITTPAVTGNEKLPVMIYLHGGGLQQGFYYQGVFDAEYLAGKGCVVISIGHRLGVFGFMSLPQLTKENGYGSGNQGIVDIIKGIEWIKANVAQFGGDPNRITVCGQSGGSSKTTAVQVAAPMQGELSGFINQSFLGAFNTYISQADAEAKGQRYLTMLGLDPNASLEDLRAMSADEINAMAAAAGPAINIDSRYIKESPVDYFLTEGRLEGVNMMHGGVYGESATSGIGIPGVPTPPEPATAEEVYAEIRSRLGDEICDKYGLEKNYYVSDWTASAMWVDFTSRNALSHDRVFDYLKSCLNETGSGYTFTWGRVTPGPREMGSEVGWHSAELWYMFGSLRRESQGMRDWQRWDYAAADVATDYWSNFVKTGDPNGSTVTEWPDGRAMGIQYVDWHTYTIVADDPIDQMCIESYIQQNWSTFEQHGVDQYLKDIGYDFSAK